MDNKEADFNKWFHDFRHERDFHEVFVTDKNFAPLICGIAQVEAFENRFINSVFSSFTSCKAALEKAELSDPLEFQVWTNKDYSKVIIFFFENNGGISKIKVYPDLKSNSFKCYCQIGGNEQQSIEFIERRIDRTATE